MTPREFNDHRQKIAEKLKEMDRFQRKRAVDSLVCPNEQAPKKEGEVIPLEKK
jgi:hypothetical protein